MFKIGLSIFRAGFNLFTYRDPYLSFLFQIGLTILMCVLVVFPWRLFFFVIGFALVGPQVSRLYFVTMVKHVLVTNSFPVRTILPKTSLIKRKQKTKPHIKTAKKRMEHQSQKKLHYPLMHVLVALYPLKYPDQITLDSTTIC